MTQRTSEIPHMIAVLNESFYSPFYSPVHIRCVSGDESRILELNLENARKQKLYSPDRSLGSDSSDFQIFYNTKNLKILRLS